MGFLIRAAFWFSLVLLALPLGGGTEEAGQPAVGPLQALAAAREAVGDIAGICERKPDVCVTGKSALHTITVRAGEAARIAGALLDENGEPAADSAETKVDAKTVEAKAETRARTKAGQADAGIVTGSVPAEK